MQNSCHFAMYQKSFPVILGPKVFDKRYARNEAFHQVSKFTGNCGFVHTY